MPQMVNTTAEKKRIQDAFSRSLSTVKKVTGDPYFGVSDFENTNQQLTRILDAFHSINYVMACTEVVPAYCKVHSASSGIVGGIGAVNKAIEGFKGSEIVERWEDNEQLFVFLHVL